MRNAIYVAVLAVGILVASHSVAQEKRERKKGNGWSLFGKGSWIVDEQTVRLGDKEKKQREKSMILSVEEVLVNASKMPKKDGKFVDEGGTSLMSHRFTPRGQGCDERKPRREAVEVAGKEIDCTVQEFVHTSKKPGPGSNTGYSGVGLHASLQQARNPQFKR